LGKKSKGRGKAGGGRKRSSNRWKAYLRENGRREVKKIQNGKVLVCATEAIREANENLKKGGETM